MMNPVSRQTSYTAGSDVHSSCAISSSWAGLFGGISQQSISWPELARGAHDKSGHLATTTRSAAFAALFGDTATSHASSTQAQSQEATHVTRPSSVASLCDSATSFSFGLPRISIAAPRQASSIQSAPQQDEQSQHASQESVQLNKREDGMKQSMPFTTQLSVQPSLSLTLKQWQTHVAALSEASILKPDETAATCSPHQTCLEQDRTAAESVGLQHTQLKLAAADGTSRSIRGTDGSQSGFVQAIPPNKRARRSKRHDTALAKGESPVSPFPVVLLGLSLALCST